MPLSSEQKNILRDVAGWLSSGKKQSLTLGGYAGTGKTTIIAALRLLLKKQRPNWRVAFCAYTGKATQVLAEKLTHTSLDLSKDSISTLHSLLYEPMKGVDDRMLGWDRKKTIPYDLIIVDEASMVTRDMWQDITSFGLPILAVGDHGQLPPIGDSFSLMAEPELQLTTIHRQAEESPIIHVATLARTEGAIPVEKFGHNVQKFDMTGSDAQLLLEDLYQSYQPGTLFLTGFNSSRSGINQAIRQTQYRNLSMPEAGDQVICLRNNWRKGIYNGMMGTLESIASAKSESDTYHSYKAEVVSDTGHLLYSGAIVAEQFGADGTLQLTPREREGIGELFDYGYALTVHKAQGSQAKRVIVIEERSRHTSDEDWARWLYTAVTRAEEELFIFGAPIST